MSQTVLLLWVIVATLGSQAVFHSSVAVYPELVEGVYPELVEGRSCTT